MSLETDLIARAEAKCELCGAADDLAAFAVAPRAGDAVDDCVLACAACRADLDAAEVADAARWRALADTMWSPVAAVQVSAWRMLNRLHDEAWARDLLDQLYLDEETLAWAEAGAPQAAGGAEHRDVHGAVLAAGDTVTLIKDLKVKGANFTAKRGTAVRGISLVPDEPTQIEGRINGQQIVILTEFVKKSG